jgi:general secretion pathway protein D
MMRITHIYALILKFALVALFSGESHAADLDKLKFTMTFDKIPVQQLVMLFYEQCEKRAIVFDPALNKLEELLTLKTQPANCAQTRELMFEAIRRAGVSIENRGSYDVIRTAPVADERDAWRELIYLPKNRDPVELAEIAVIAVRRGSFAHQRRNAAVQISGVGQQVPESGFNGASISAKQIDKLVFYGPSDEAKAVESLLVRLDVPHAQIEVKAGIFEYQSGVNQGSGIDAVVSLLNSKLSLSIGSGAVVGNTLRLNVSGIDAALSLLDKDSRFKYVARPRVLVKDGESARFFAGESVRVVGSVTVDKTGNPLQSKESLSAGVTLEATVKIRGDVVEMSLFQAVSNFVSNSNGDPSVLTRDLRTRLMMKPGIVYVIGGLQSSRNTQAKSTFLGFQLGKSLDTSDTEVLLLLSVNADQSSL